MIQLCSVRVQCPFRHFYSFRCVWNHVFYSSAGGLLPSFIRFLAMCQLDHLIWFYIQRNYRNSTLTIFQFSSINQHWAKQRSRVQSKRLQLYSKKSYCSDVRRPKKRPMTVSKARSFIRPSLVWISRRSTYRQRLQSISIANTRCAEYQWLTHLNAEKVKQIKVTRVFGNRRKAKLAYFSWPKCVISFFNF